MHSTTPAQPSRGGLQERVIPFTAGDGLALNLIHVRGRRDPHRGPVLLIHGAGVRANIFRAPVETTIVDALIDAGYDVWLENWRASIDVPPNHWNLDQAARFDHPEAVRTVLREARCDRLKAIVHCQGSTSFMMSAVAGLVPEVETVVSNAVSLHPVVPPWSRLKLRCLVPAARMFIDHLDPGWGLRARGAVPRLLTALVRLTHHECDSTVCKLVSFVYGAGRPALWSHANLGAETHAWLAREFGFVPLGFHAQMQRCVQRGSLVAVAELPDLPRDFVAERPRTAARFAFFAGADNRCFSPESQRRTHAYFAALRRDYHTLHIIPGYGHLDMFMGERAAHDVFPRMISELDRA